MKHGKRVKVSAVVFGGWETTKRVENDLKMVNKITIVLPNIIRASLTCPIQ